MYFYYILLGIPDTGISKQDLHRFLQNTRSLSQVHYKRNISKNIPTPFTHTLSR